MRNTTEGSEADTEIVAPDGSEEDVPEKLRAKKKEREREKMSKKW